jgi:putative tricarboxylic transport membrane protein
MKRFERIAAGALFVVGSGAAYLAVEMGYGSARFPGPGFLPFWIASLLALTAGLYFLARLGPDTVPRRLWERDAWRRPGLSAVIMLLFTLLMGWLGFFASTFLLFLAWLIAVERERWLTIGAVSALGTLGAYILFAVLLKVPLPKGFLF